MDVTFPENAGLGNRLKCIASACLRSAEGEELRIHWRRKLVPFRFHDVFSLAGIPATEDELAAGTGPTISTWRLMPLFNHEPPIDCLFDATPEPYLTLYRIIFSKFIPNRASLAIEASLGHFDYSVHVRANPIQARELEPMKELGYWADDDQIVRPLSVYVDLLNSLNGRVYLSCHNLATQQAILANVHRDKQPVVLPGKDFTSGIHAVADLLALGRAAHFYAYRGSSFSEIAWWLGGCRAAVTAI